MLTINNPGIDRDDLACAHPGRPHAARICTRSGAAALQLAASESKCVPPVFTLPSVLLLGDASFHLHHLGPSFVLVCILIVLYVLFKGAFGLNPLPTTEDPVISEAKTSDGRTPQLTNEPPRLVGEFGRSIVVCCH